ncbi:hypothetical protein STEG23_019371, partial [Scotinomys teguina]
MLFTAVTKAPPRHLLLGLLQTASVAMEEPVQWVSEVGKGTLGSWLWESGQRQQEQGEVSRGNRQPFSELAHRPFRREPVLGVVHSAN